MNVGRLRKALLAPAALGVAGGLVALVSLVFAWGFVVDDALIVARFARVVRTTGHHAFTVGGPTVDGVTPLPYPWLIAPFAGSVTRALLVQRVLGVLAVVLGFGFLAQRLARACGPRALLGVFVACASFPLAVHASSGLETGLAAGLVAAAFACGVAANEDEDDLAASALVFGLACTLRPELLPGALAAVAVRLTHARALGLLVRAAGPSLAVVAVRLACFGSPVPLAVFAKPSDLRHGALYATAGLVVTGLSCLVLLAFPAFRTTSSLAASRRSALALVTVHTLVVAFVGGDWMPYARLLVPVVPALAVLAASVSSIAARALLAALVLAANLAFGWRHRATAVAVWFDRVRVIDALEPVLQGRTRVAGLDIGFLGAAFAGPVVDLAGLTDPAVAGLRGGHTSKVLPEGFLDERLVDALVLWAPPGSRTEFGSEALFGRVVETRLARSRAVASSFVESARLPWGSAGGELVVFVRR